MKKITSILIVLTLLPACALAQNRRAAAKAVERAALRGSSRASSGVAESVNQRVERVLRASQANAEREANARNALKTPDQRTLHDAAVLRSRLLEHFQPTITANAQAAQNRDLLKQALGGKELRWEPSERLSKEKRRLNLPLAASLLLNHKQAVIKGYSLTQDYLEGYYLRRIHPYLAHPAYQADKSGHMYRGIFMTVEELASTLKNGFSVDMNTWNVGAKTEGGKFISFSSSTGEALSYVFQGTGTKGHPNGVGVVFEVDPDLDGLEFWEDPLLNSTKTIYHCYQDVPAGKIRNVYIFGQYGLENLAEVIIKARTGQIKDREAWIHAFDLQFLR